MPEPVEGFEVFKADEHAECAMVTRMTSSTGIDGDPEMEVSEILGFLSCANAGYLTLTPDVVDCLQPWRGDLDENVVLKDFLSLSIYLVAS